MNRYPSLFVFLFCACAVLMYVYAGKYIALGVALSAVILAVCFRKFLVICLASGLCAGTFLAQLYSPPAFSNPDYASREYSAIVIKSTINSFNSDLTVEVDGESPFRARIKVYDSPFLIDAGDEIKFSAILYPADSVTDIPFVSSRRLSLLSGRISAVGYVDGNDIEIIGQSDALIYRLKRLTINITESFKFSTLTPYNRSLLSAAFFGRDYASEEQLEQFSGIGLIHLLCVSGFHVGLVAILLNFILFPFKASVRLRKLRYSLFIAGIWVFVGLCGVEPSAVRAAGMLTALTFCLAVDRSHNPLNALGFGCLVVLAINPYWLFSIGFQLSATATAGIICLYMSLPDFHTRKDLYFNKALMLVRTPAFALLFSGPILILYFHHIPLTSILSSVIGSVVFTAFVLCGGISVCAGLLGIGGQWISVPANCLGSMLEELCNRLSVIEKGADYALYPSVAQTFLFFSAVIVAIYAFNEYGRRRFVALGLCVLFACMIPFLSVKPRNCVIFTGNAVLCVHEGQGNIIHFIDNPATDYLPFFHGNKAYSVLKSRHRYGSFSVGNGTEIIRLTGRKNDGSALGNSEAEIAIFTEAAKSIALNEENIPETLKYIIVAAFMPAEEKIRFRSFAREHDLHFIDLAIHRAAVIDLRY